MQVDLYCDERKTLPEDIEPYIRKCLVNLIVKPEGNSHYAFAWARTEMFAIGGTFFILLIREFGKFIDEVSPYNWGESEVLKDEYKR